MIKTNKEILKMSAYELMDTFCPQGEAVEGVCVYQDFDNETTIIKFDDTSVQICGSYVKWDNQQFCTGDLDTTCEDCQCCAISTTPHRVWKIKCAKNGEAIESRLFKGSLNEFLNTLERDVLIIGIPEDISSQVGHVNDVMEQINNLSPSPRE